MKKIIIGLVIGFSLWGSSVSASVVNLKQEVIFNEPTPLEVCNKDKTKLTADVLTASTKYTTDIKAKDDIIASLKKDNQTLQDKINYLESDSQKIRAEYEAKIYNLGSGGNGAPTIIYKTEKVNVVSAAKKETTPVVSTPIKTEIIPDSLIEVPVKQTLWQKIISWFK